MTPSSITGKNCCANVPFVIWSASSASIPGPFPKILLAVRIPETRTLPVELIPTPPVNTPTAV